MDSSSSSYSYSTENTTSTIFANVTLGTPKNLMGANDWRKEVIHAPDWLELWQQLRWAWQLHTYGMACLFMALTCASFFTILGLRAQLSSRPHMSSLNVFLCLLGATRAMVLFIDPYAYKKAMPLVMSRIMWDLGFPCLLSAFALLQLYFLRMSKVRVIVPSSKLSSETGASVIVTSHFCLIIMSDILWAVRNSFRIVWLLTQVTFVIWGLFLCLTFLCGCLRLLRSVTKLPLPFVSQNEAGYEIKGMLPTDVKLPNGHGHSSGGGVVEARPLQHHNNHHNHQPMPNHLAGAYVPPVAADNRLKPKIRITDVNEQTYSYVSDGSPAAAGTAFSEQIPQRDDTMRSLPILESTMRHSWSPRKTQFVGESDDPAVTRPLMSDRESAPANLLAEDHSPTVDTPMSEIRQNGPATISALHKGGSYVQRTQRMSDHLEEFKFDTCKLKSNSRRRLEKLLRKLVVTSMLGTILCLLRAYDIFGPHGLSSTRRQAAVIPWFCYQTINRLVEFFMGCCMACLTRQSLHNHCYHYYGVLGKRRDPYFYTSQ